MTTLRFPAWAALATPILVASCVSEPRDYSEGGNTAGATTGSGGSRPATMSEASRSNHDTSQAGQAPRLGGAAGDSSRQGIAQGGTDNVGSDSTVKSNSEGGSTTTGSVVAAGGAVATGGSATTEAVVAMGGAVVIGGSSATGGSASLVTSGASAPMGGCGTVEPTTTVTSASSEQCLYGGRVIRTPAQQTVICDPHCVDDDHDGRPGYDDKYCATGNDRCDRNCNNWTETGCASCVDQDNDGYGVACDKGSDCDDNESTRWQSCPTPTLRLSSTIEADTSTRAIDSRGSFLYVLLGAGYGTLRIYDLTKPAEPALLSSLSLDATSGCWYGGSVKLDPSGNYAYLYGCGNRGVPVIDVSNHAAPAFITRLTDVSATAMDLDICGNQLYAATQARGIAAFDITTPAAPAYESEAVIGGKPYPYGVTCWTKDATTDYVYLGDGGTNQAPAGLRIYEYNKTAHTFTARGTYLPSAESWGGKGVALSENQLFLTWANTSSLALFDVSNKDIIPSPTVFSGRGSTNTDILAAGRLLYSTDSWQNLAVFDISNPASMTRLATYPTNNSVVGITKLLVGAATYLAYTINGSSTVTVLESTGM